MAAHFVTNLSVPLSRAASILIAPDLLDDSDPVPSSIQTITRCLLESSLAKLASDSKRLAFSKDLYLSVDTGSDSADRDRMVVKFGGEDLSGLRWSFVAAIKEVTSHCGKMQVQVIADAIKKIASFQNDLGLPQIGSYSFRLIVYDSTCSNTGRSNGLFHHFSELRRKDW